MSGDDSSLAWRIARRALELGSFAWSPTPDRDAMKTVEYSDVAAAALASRGCGPFSYEVSLAPGFVASRVASVPNTCEPLDWWAHALFEHVRELAARGLISDADRKRARTLTWDSEQAELARKREAESKREAERAAAEARRSLTKRREEAMAQLAALEKKEETDDAH